MIKNKIAMITLVTAVVFTGCTKDEVNPKNSQSTNTHDFQRSSYTDIELFGMAANIDEIQYSSGSYNVSFYGSTANYSVDVVTCVIDSIIQIDITHGAQTSKAVIDFDRKTLDIENDQDFSFRDLESIQVSASSSVLFRVATVVISQHLDNPQMSITFVDNGSSDVFPVEDPEDRKCCICSSTTTNGFFPGLCIDTTYQTVFWITLPPTQGDAYAC